MKSWLEVSYGRFLIAALSCFVATAAHAENTRVGPERCAECHKKEFKAWDSSTHARLLSDAEDDEVLAKTEEIPERLGIDDIETDPACSGCHFSSYLDEGEEQITSIDCESCHGAASAWVDVHSDYGARNGEQIERAEDEDPAHKSKRLADGKAAGWLHPDEIVRVASNCLRCHTGPGERVVDVGGHPPGSEFELVSWLSGEVRHNFHRTNQGANAAVTPERARQLYVVGRALDLEYALRGLAVATQDGPYLKAMTGRVTTALANLEAIAGKSASAEVGGILSAGKAVALKANNRAQAESAADRIHGAAEAFAAKHAGSGLAALDPLVPKQVKGSAHTGN